MQGERKAPGRLPRAPLASGNRLFLFRRLPVAEILEWHGESARIDYRREPLDVPTAFGPVVTCAKCGKKGADDQTGKRIVHLAWFSGEIKMAGKCCPK